MKNYTPKPIDLDNIIIDADLTELQEAIAENAHEIWARNRQAEGWTYGPERNDQLKQTPDMVPYNDLPDSEKQYDRDMAMETIKLIYKLGYDVVKREETALKRTLKHDLQHNEVYSCPECGSSFKKFYVFCPQCGKELK